jgi:23S rRNA (cytosine1962-C5)-methyltransferase
VLPCVLFEDEHLLVINKPAGISTHSPSPYAGEGIYEWLRDREPRWARLAIVHRLDKETSGVLVFAKSELAARSLTAQFTRHTARKIYFLLTDRPVGKVAFTMESAMVRAGARYVSRPIHAGSERAVTHFEVAGTVDNAVLMRALPVTGKTHQIRVHAAASGFPILGDVLYGGTPAGRVCLHAGELTVEHPLTAAEKKFTAPVDFFDDANVALREGLIDRDETNAFRFIHGASDGWPGWYVDRLGDFLLSQFERPLSKDHLETLGDWLAKFSLRGAYHKTLVRRLRTTNVAGVSPRKVLGAEAPDEFVVRENGVQFAIRFGEGNSVGLFLDQRENRRRLLAGYLAAGFSFLREGERPREPWSSGPGSSGDQNYGRDWASPGGALAGMEVLNAFAYTCGFSVCAAAGGARTTNLDLSRKYLEWGRRNFALNGMDPAGHDFIYGDAFDWLRRLARKGRQFDVVVLDPPTFSLSKEHGPFQARQDYGRLTSAAVPLIKPDGLLFASTNAAGFSAEKFLEQIAAPIESARRRVVRQHFAPQPPDFPTSRAEPGYLKTVWLQVG